MKSSRPDLTKWAVHFIHDYNPNYAPDHRTIKLDMFEGVPYHEDKCLDDRFDDWRIKDVERFPIGYEPSAFEILLKIIDDGHIRSTRAFRNNRPTVYGPRAAVCFTEMPLYAFIDYARNRSNDEVGSYAIGVLKKELFQAGGRPVIYGLSGRYIEQPQPSDRKWLRTLDPSCGISEIEQYRYVAMSHDPDRLIDWSHEREWRWVDHNDQCSCPGIPILLSEEPISFTEVLIVVPKSTEVEPVLNLLAELYDAGQNDYLHPFSKEALNSTSVIALDQLKLDTSDIGTDNIRLEDIPSSRIQKVARPPASPDLVARVRSVLDKAREAADAAAEEHLRTAPRTKDGRHIADVVGSAYLVVSDSQSPIVSALLNLDDNHDEEVFVLPGIGYFIPGIGGTGWREEQALSIAEVAVRAAKSVFDQHFPDVTFEVRSYWD